jgi:hypothetical protein
LDQSGYIEEDRAELRLIYEKGREAVDQVDRTVNHLQVKQKMHAHFTKHLAHQFRKEEREDLAEKAPSNEFKKRVLRSVEVTRHRTEV